MARWALRLQPYDYQLIHRKGKDHVVPDFLSRSVPVTVDVLDPVTSSFSPDFSVTEDKWYKNLISKIKQHPWKFPAWRIENSMLYKYIDTKTPNFSSTSTSWKVVVPKDKRTEVLKRCHDIPAAGHVGTFKTYWKVHESYYWPKMKSDISRYVKACQICSQNKVLQKAPPELMGDRPEIREPWQCISLDYI